MYVCFLKDHTLPSPLWESERWELASISRLATAKRGFSRPTPGPAVFCLCSPITKCIEVMIEKAMTNAISSRQVSDYLEWLFRCWIRGTAAENKLQAKVEGYKHARPDRPAGSVLKTICPVSVSRSSTNCSHLRGLAIVFRARTSKSFLDAGFDVAFRLSANSGEF